MGIFNFLPALFYLIYVLTIFNSYTILLLLYSVFFISWDYVCSNKSLFHRHHAATTINIILKIILLYHI